tara:strand:+ start:597 stop:926 length:330 start_codon:yes stop_codon:yes gene_type:complete
MLQAAAPGAALAIITMEVLIALPVLELQGKAMQVEEGLLEAMEAVVVAVPVLLLEPTVLEVMAFNLRLLELRPIMVEAEQVMLLIADQFPVQEVLAVEAMRRAAALATP